MPIKAKFRLLTASSIAGLCAITSHPARAQEAPPPPPVQSPAQPSAEPAPDSPGLDAIIVIGNRTIIAALKDVLIEDSYDEDAVAAFGVGSVGEVLAEVRRENGDDEPAIFVNGRPVSNIDDIAGLPSEAIARIEVLPRGSATQVGGQPGQRAYNVVLRPTVKSATLTASREEATENGWSNHRGEAVLTYIKGQNRVNLTIRGARSDALLESERNFIPRGETTPYAPFGNLIPASGSEIDPALSILAGQPVSILALPPAPITPTLASLLPGANRINPSEQSAYRTLRGPSSPVDIGLSGNKVLNPWLSLSFNARFAWSRNETVSGLPSALFLIPQTNPNTPFSVPVFLALNDPARPLLGISEGNSQAVSVTLNAQRGPWHAALIAKWDRRENSYLSQFTGSLGALGTVSPATNPFAGTLAAMIPVSQRESNSRNTNSQLQFEVQGPIIALWAGPLSTRANLGVSRVDYRADDLSGPRAIKRTELSVKAGITIPLTSKQFGFLPQLGESELEFDYGSSDLGAFGKLNRRSIAVNWQPSPWLRFVALDSREERKVALDLLAAPIVVTPNLPFFDPLTGQTVEVTTIYGGSANLADEEYRTRSFGLTITPLKKYSLNLNAEYAVNDLRNQVGPLPLPSTAVIAAFPERFVRDSSGTLVLVDNRSINFTRQRSELLRFGLRFSVPLSGPGAIPPREAGKVRRRTPPLRLSFNLSQTTLLNSTAVIRPGLPEVNLLEGGAIGIGGGQQRHTTRAGLALARGSTGIRIEYFRRGSSSLATGTALAPNLLHFAPLSTIDLRAFTELADLFPKANLPRGARITLVIDNLANRRQRVTDNAGLTPQAYQPVRRDPIGRTVMLELRLVL